MAAFARLKNDQLIAGNDLVERRWRVAGGQLLAVSLLDKRTNRQWCRQEAPAAVGQGGQAASLGTTRMRTSVSDEFLRAQLISGETTHCFDIFDDLPGITQRLNITAQPGYGAADASAAPSGIESDAPKTAATDASDLADCLAIEWLHCDFIAVEMLEQTDGRDNLVFLKRWMLQPAERHASAAGNVFFLEHRASGDGLAILKHAPAPYARAVRSAIDCSVVDGVLQLRGLGIGSADGAGGAGYAHSIMCYSGGASGRTAALQQLQHRLRPYRAGRDGQLLSNTWGDRNRDAALCESFLLREADAGARLGVDVMQIDDGWQKGRSANSADKGRVWNGFWASDADFWTPDRGRLPGGLAPLLDRLTQHKMGLGLWYAPDSADDCVNWQRDAEQVLRLWREHGVRHVKIDAVKMHTKAAEARVAGFYQQVLRESAGEICFDADVTAEVRPGFWGMLDAGPIFVENRYTDWHRYWPHLTLRNLWLLSHYIPPVRLRMEFLNNQRNAEKYGDDPLRPARYSPDTLFAMVMFASPLGWFELTHLPEDYFTKVPPLVKLWKEHRAAIHSSTILPIGQEPDGFTWTGFRTLGESGFAVLFNELSPGETFLLEGVRGCRLLHGDAVVTDTPEGAVIRITKPLGHAFVQFSAPA